MLKKVGPVVVFGLCNGVVLVDGCAVPEELAELKLIGRRGPPVRANVCLDIPKAALVTWPFET